MNHIFAFIYAAASITSIIACIPQLTQILRTKNVEGISLQTYDMWFIMQLFAIPYTIQSGDMLWVAAGILWATYYLTIILLIEHYHYPHYIRVIVARLVSVLRVIPVHAK
jgi:uncharacterized protein with PQ loop repeat